ncbi:MAG: permease [archaeon]
MISEFSNWLVYGLFGISAGSPSGAALEFFVSDAIKILLMLLVMITLISYLRTYVSEERIRKSFTGKKAGAGNIAAASFGALTPFCSCSSIPIFLSFVEMGIPLGVAFSFLITSPLINEYLAVLMFATFGLKVTAIYIASGMAIGILGGILLDRLGMEKYLIRDVTKLKSCSKKAEPKSWQERLSYSLSQSNAIIRRIFPYVLLGLAVGAYLHAYIPEATVQSLITRTGIFAVPLAVALGVPLYANCAAIVPIAVVLFQKGIPLGTVLAFMMSTAALSLPEAVILSRVMKPRLVAVFFAVIALAIIFTGYLFNLII